MDNIKLSVRELVETVYKGGDLNSGAMSADRAAEGMRVHRILQSDMGESYQKEYFLKHEFEYGDILFTVEGRADGIINRKDFVAVDEIKSTYNDLGEIDENYNTAHIAQAKCYGYIYSLEKSLEKINIQMRYCNIDTKNVKTLEFEFSKEELEKFFYQLLDYYIEWARMIISISKTRRESIDKLSFPFEDYRKGQRDFSVAVFNTIKKGKKLFVQAPTGVGKTISVLFPAIKAMNFKHNSKIFYLTGKSSTKTIAFSAVKMMVEKGLNARTTVITAKEKICFKDETNCDPEYCEYARGYYDKLNRIIVSSVKNDVLYDREYIEKIAGENVMCPFELSLDLSYMSDLVICDYNYYFDPRVGFQREDVINYNNDILLIDEAHNLEDRARNMYSPEIIKEEFFSVSKLMKDEKKIKRSLNSVNKKFLEIKKSSDGSEKVLEDEPSDLINSLRKFIIAAEEYMNDKKNENVPDEFKDIYFKAVFFVRISDMADENFCYYYEPGRERNLVKLLLIDPSKTLKEIEKKALSSVFFSATLTPLKFFRYLFGGESGDYTLKLESPFPEDNLKLMIAADISMKYSVRDSNIEQVCLYINAAISGKKGNYMVFFPSYAFLDKVSKVYLEIYGDAGIIIQNQSFTEEEQAETVEMFSKENGVVLFTVVGGVFSEGIDLPLDKLIGAVIIGTGIPQISFERDIIKNFFDGKFNSGFDFAYKYPGWNKVLQSAGRVIRTENDRGIVLLIDSRLCQKNYIDLFPRHWGNYKKIYDVEELKKEISSFWSREES
jgi:Rad3-related DNA helicase